MIADYMPPPAGHPHDPRTLEDDDDPTADVIEDIRQFLIIAETAAINGDLIKARKALVEARMSLEDLVGTES